MNTLEGKIFVVTGTLSLPRNEVKNTIINAGGKFASSVSSKTNFVVCGTEPGNNKLERADELGIPIISESEFLAML